MTLIKLMGKVMKGDLQIPSLPSEFKPIVQGCLQKDRRQRWTAQQVLSVLSGSQSPQSSQTPLQKGKNFVEDLGKGVKLEIVYIPAGTFMMGTDDAEMQRLHKEYNHDWFKSEAPQHRVTLKAFYMAKYPITQAQYQAIMGNNPSYFSNAENTPLSKGGWGDHPVEQVSWDMAQEFCQQLSRKLGKKFSLPSETQWEYACRAGSTGKWCFGDDKNKLKEYAWYDDNSHNQTHPVGQKKSNNWGLYDMHGNVCEWCEDDYADNYNNTPNDGVPYINSNIKHKCKRGGSYVDEFDDCRCASRSGDRSANDDCDYGLRIICLV